MKKTKKFAEMIKELEDVVAGLEKDKGDIESSFELYKKGMDLSKACFSKLKEIETEITIVTEENGEIVEKEVTREELSGEDARVINNDISQKEEKVKEKAEAVVEEDVKKTEDKVEDAKEETSEVEKEEETVAEVTEEEDKVEDVKESVEESVITESQEDVKQDESERNDPNVLPGQQAIPGFF